MTIHINEILYCERPTTATTYSDIPNDSPDIPRLLNGQKPFPSSETVMQKVPKKIILDLNFYYYLLDREKRTFKQNLQHMQDDGLSVYYYHKNQLHTYDSELIDRLNKPFSFPPIEQLSQILNIPIDELFVGYGDLIADSSGCDATSEGTSNITLLRNREKIHSIHLDCTNSLLKQDDLLNQFPDIKTFFLISKDYEQLRDFKKYSGLSKIEKVDFGLTNSSIASVQLSEILAGMNTEVLELRYCKNITKALPEAWGCSELKQLDVSYSLITDIALNSILKAASKLQVLKLTKCLKINDGLSEEIWLSELQELYVNESTIPGKFLASLLENAKKLKILDLCDYKNFKELPSLKHLKFPYLEEIRFTFDGTNNDVLIQFLLNAPNIKRLTIFAGTQMKNELPDGLNFSKLEDLEIINFSDSLFKILNTAHQLKRLALTSSETIYGELPSDLYLPELKDLELRGADFTKEFILKLLDKSPHLETLNLTNCPEHFARWVDQLQRPGLHIILPHIWGEDETIDNELSDYEQAITEPQNSLVYNAHSQKNTIDANTKAQEQTFHVDRVFMGKPRSPDPRELRYETFDSFVFNEQSSIQEPFLLHNRNSDYRLSPDFSELLRSQDLLFDSYSKSGPGHYFCRTNLLLTSHFQALPSAFADELLEQFYIDPAMDIEIVKSHYTNLHYIRLKNWNSEPQKVTFEMLLTRQKPKVSFSNLPDEVREIAKFCRGFREEALKKVSSKATPEEFLEALIKERAGACRHRSIAFMYLMESLYPEIPVRLVRNTVHMFVEVYFDGQWVACDLGGYPAKVQINEHGLPEYEPGEEVESNPDEVYAQTISDTGTSLAPDFFHKARNLTNLTLDNCSHLPLQHDLSRLDTLNITNSPLSVDEFQKLLTLTPHLKTLNLKNCTMTPEEFNRLDLSSLKQLEHISLSGSFIPDIQSVLRIKQTAPKARWIIESEHLSLEKGAPIDLEIRKKSRSLPSRYFAHRTRDLEAKKEAFEILTSAEPSKKTLVHASDAETARLFLQKTAASLGQLHYYIDSPDVLRCAGPYIRREGHLGIIENQPGGPLYDFLNSNPGTPKKLIINYDAFKMSDFASFNSLLDDPRVLDGIELPSDVHIIGLLNQNNPNVYQGADFYSRFDEFQSLAQINEKLSLNSAPLEANSASTTEILELCGGEKWESRLIGQWLLQEGRLIFKEGLLLEALKAGKTAFSFNNAPLYDPKFVSFFHDLTLHGHLIHQGFDYGPLPKDFQVVLTQGVHIPRKDDLLIISPENTLTSHHQFLNQANLGEFLGQYLLDEKQQQLNFQEGLIAQHGKKVLPVYLTGSLSFYTWLRLLEACRQHETILQVTLAPGIQLPKELAMDTAQIPQRPVLNPTSSTAFNPQEFPENSDMVIDVGDLKPDELLATFKCNGFNAKTNQFEFTPIKIRPWDALKDGKTIVLKGEWTQELADAVQTIMFARLQQENPPGKLIIYSEQPQLFHALPEIPFNKAMKKLPQSLNKPVEYEERFNAVEAALKEHPFVLITGATGIGKTHFVSRTWKEAHPACYYGEEHLLDFLEDDSSDEFITLYLNEANLANKDWSLFEGLFNNPPAIFYKNQYYPLSSRHKIIFDGNPIGYGGERHTPRLFQNHPYQLHFQPLPREVLSQMIALPPPLDEPILDVVMYMASLNPQDTLLTPREIKMMSMLVKTSMAKYPHIQPEQLARYFAYTLSKNHVPRSFQNEFETHFKVASPFKLTDALHSQSHLLNDSNLPAAIALQNHLLVREDRRQKKKQQSLETGLGGLVIEGESGEGKSQLILTQLTAQGYQKDKDFIYISAKAKPNEIKEKLLKGFHEGLIVVIDEMNSLPLPEQLLNALLEGHDLKDQPPQKPGFLLLGTQNPITYRGRLKTTSPLEHRLQKVLLPTSTLAEKKHILQQLGLPSRIAQDMIAEYAQRKDLTFREVIKIAKQWLKHHQNQPPIQLDMAAVKQVGSTGKIVAIANVEHYYAQKLGYKSMPLKSEHQERLSIRKLAKKHASSQGEILEFESWRQTLKDLGFISEVIDFHDNMNHFVSSITDNLKQGNLPLIAFPLDRSSGLPNPETKEPEDVEHAAVISGYNWKTDEFTLVHWGKSYVVDAVTLFNSTHKLVDTRHQEFYTKNPAYGRSKEPDVIKYLSTTDAQHPHLAKKSVIPQKGTGFKAKLLIVQAPDKELLLKQRETLEHQPKRPERHSFFKEAPKSLLEEKPDSSFNIKNKHS